MINFPENHVFVQIGANVGNDEFEKICKERNPSKIILIDPFITEELKNRYKQFGEKVTYENYAIVDNANKKSIDIFVPLDVKAHASIIPMKTWNAPKYTVPCTTIGSILQKHEVTRIRFLYIDTEGYDSRIINSLDLNQFKIDLIRFEHWGFKRDDYNVNHELQGIEGIQVIKNKLESNGYTIKFVDDVEGKNYVATKLIGTPGT
jgi:FkbM family methyltransferase